MSTSMRRLVKAGTLGMAGLVATTLAAIQSPGAFGDEFKRRDDVAGALVTVADDDDDDADPRDDSNSRSWSGNSSRSRDATNSRMTRVSRDRDRSRGDLTRDRTRDGRGDWLRKDFSKRATNDRSRNDSRRWR